MGEGDGDDGAQPPGPPGSENRKKLKAGHRFNKGPKYAKFEGNCDKLKGNISDCTGYNQADTFVKTQERIAMYVGGSSHHSNKMVKAVETLTKPTITTPKPPADHGQEKSNLATKFLWEQEANEAIRDRKEVDSGIQKLYLLVYGQCSEALIARIQLHGKFKKVSDDQDGIELLKIICGICFNFQDQKYVPQSIHEAKKRFYSIGQGKFETAAQCCEKYQNNVQVLEQCGGVTGPDTALWQVICKAKGLAELTTDANEQKIIKTVAQERILATGFILGADHGGYASMIRSLENAFTSGRDEWPKTLNGAYHMMTNWKHEQSGSVSLESEGMSFGTDGSKRKPRDRSMRRNQLGHAR